MPVPIILGADKTTVLIATGQTEYDPLYASIGNVHNTVRRGHGDAVVSIAFLAIPKGQSLYLSWSATLAHILLTGSAADEKDADFRAWKKQLYHTSIARILMPLEPSMTKPEIVLCPDSHFRKAMYTLGPFIADYPEQVYLAGIVQGWCAKYV